MKKFIFFDIVSFTLCCLESLILQHGADSSMVEEEFRDTMASNSYSDHHWIHFTNRHKRELGHAPFHSNGNSNEEASAFQLYNDLQKPEALVAPATSTTLEAPKFNSDQILNTTLVTSVGQTVYLHCLVDNIGDRKVSWIRRSDLKILTIGEILYTQDKRFSPLHNEGSNVWMLKLTNPQLKDSGEYECQVSYHDDKEEKLRMPYRLIVLDSHAHIQDSADLYVQIGSKLVLTCYVKQSSGPPEYVFWYQGDEVLNYSPKVKIEEFFRKKDKISKSYKSDPFSLPNDKTLVARDNTHLNNVHFGSNNNMRKPSNDLISTLSVENVKKKIHSGNYTCAPSNARKTSIMVHVVDDESGPAAMQHGNSATNLKPLQVFQVTGTIITEFKHRVLGSFQFINKKSTKTSVKTFLCNNDEFLKIIINSIRPIFILLLVVATQFLLYTTFQTYCISTNFILQQNLIYNQNQQNTNKSVNEKVKMWERLHKLFIPMHLDYIYDPTNELLQIKKRVYVKSNRR